MFDLIIQLIFMVSFGVIVYMIALAVPRVSDEEMGITEADTKLASFAKKLPLEKIDAAFMASRDKILRRLKIYIMKADNFVTHRLNKKEHKL